MSSPEFDWKSLLHTDAPRGCSLKAALFTTYDRADERLLAEDLLPWLLKLDRKPESDGAERQYFLLELDKRLQQLHGQLVVVSSTAHDEPAEPQQGEDGTYGWIWRSVRHLTVGYRGKAVQHAKLWLLHWGAADKNDDEYLELVVSSCNLTRPAFTGQIQGAWRACVRLEKQPPEPRLARWGILPGFLEELSASTGDGAPLEPFVELLKRADCPQGVSFVASVPGTHSRQVLRRTPWGVAGLQEIMPSGRGAVSVSILSPYIGSWSTNAFARWCKRCESQPHRLTLAWIDRDHPWKRRWLLLNGTRKTLTEAGARFVQLRHDCGDDAEFSRFHEEHRAKDDRWSHAKVYAFQRGTSRRLVVTSANFSQAAWGSESRDGSLTIQNFELGVCVEQAAWPFSDLPEFDDARCAWTVSNLPGSGSNLIMWAGAAWDGKGVHVECRCEDTHKLTGTISGGAKPKRIGNWKVLRHSMFQARVSWTDGQRPPCSVQLRCGHETVEVPVFDERPVEERERALPPEVDKDVAQMMRDALLLEQYGGRIAADGESEDATCSTPEPGAPGSDEEKENGETMASDSYEVPAFSYARELLGVVDNWACQLKRAPSGEMGEFERQVLRRDGELLREAFKRQAERIEKHEPARAIGAKLAAEELTPRLKHFPEA